MTETRITKLLHRLSEDQPGIADRLYARAYTELRAIARRRLAREWNATDLSPTALVNEAYLRLADGDFENRRHFFGAAARAMEQVLVDRARRALAAKRGQPVPLDPRDHPALNGVSNVAELLDLHEALQRLEEVDARKAEIVRGKVFLELTMQEIADALEVSLSTVEKDWAIAKTWLRAATEDSD